VVVGVLGYWFFFFGFDIMSVTIHSFSKSFSRQAYILCLALVALQLINKVFGVTGIVAFNRVYGFVIATGETGGGVVNATGFAFRFLTRV
jgi:hypothetical protein